MHPSTALYDWLRGAQQRHPQVGAVAGSKLPARHGYGAGCAVPDEHAAKNCKETINYFMFSIYMFFHKDDDTIMCK